MPTVCTILMPAERSRIDAAGSGYFAARHQESPAAALRALRRSAVDAVLVSVHRCDPAVLRDVGILVREFPAIPTVAVVSRHDPSATEALLGLGAKGVRAVVDLTAPAGWQHLRDLIAHPASPVVARVLGRLLPALEGTPPDTRLFFEVSGRLAPVVGTVRGLSRHLGVPPSTLMSRFFRAGLPSPKRYLVMLRLLHAAYLFETPGFAVADIAYRLDYSSPQSFGRHLRNTYGITATEFRQRFPFEAALEHFMATMIEPYREGLRCFRPLHNGALDRGHQVGSGVPSREARGLSSGLQPRRAGVSGARG